MHNEIDEAILKLSELSIEKREFALEFIYEAHRQENQSKKEERKAHRISDSEDMVKFHTSTGTVYKDKNIKILHRGDRVRIKTSRSIQGIIINKVLEPFDGGVRRF